MADSTDDEIVTRMATALVSANCDLGDDRVTLRVLIENKFSEDDIVFRHDEAVEAARIIISREVIGHG